jgi:hypothetical protein
VIAAGGEPHRVGGVVDQRERGGVEPDHLVEDCALRGRVGAKLSKSWGFHSDNQFELVGR